jgi:PD-(D/E)XK endonuclease
MVSFVKARANGNPAEAALLKAFVEREMAVLLPFGEGQSYDLVVHLRGNAFLRVQCKTARAVGGCLEFNSRTTDHGRGRLPYLGLADAFGVYFPLQRSIFLVPVGEVSSFRVRLRLEPALNNQRRNIRLAADYAIDRWTVEALCEIVGRRMPPSKSLARQSRD